MLGVPVVGPTTMYGDNMSVVLNTTVPSSQLKKKHNAIAYHRVREAIAANIVTLHHIPSHANIADVLTKPLPVNTFQTLVDPVLFREQNLRKHDLTVDPGDRLASTGEPNPTEHITTSGEDCPAEPPSVLPTTGESLLPTPGDPRFSPATMASRALHLALYNPTL